MTHASNRKNVNFSDSTMVDLLRRRAEKQPEQTAYVYLKNGETEESRLTFAQLDQRAQAIAAELQQKSQIGSRILLLYPTSTDYLEAFFGCLYAKMAAVPLFPPFMNRTLERLECAIADSGATVALTTSAIQENAEYRIAQVSALKQLQWIASDRISTDFRQSWRTPAIDSHDLAFLQYTSGSTRSPKGVMVCHNNLLQNAALQKEGFGNTPESSHGAWLPLYHDMGLIAIALQSLYIGAPCYLISPTDFLRKPFRWLKMISDYGLHVTGAPNFAYDLCAKKISEEQRAQLDLSSLRVAFNGSEPVHAETFERFVTAFADCGFKREAFCPCYGLAETTVFVSSSPRNTLPLLLDVDHDTYKSGKLIPPTPESRHYKKIVGCGRICLDLEVAIVDPETRRRQPTGKIGEIWLSHASVAKGYWNLPQETEETFNAVLEDNTERRFLRTGDLGAVIDGEICITGRLKDLIIIEGRNHYPQDIEGTVENCHALIRAGGSGAFSVDTEVGERLVVIAEIDPRELQQSQDQFDPDNVIAAIRQSISIHHDIRAHDIVLLKFGQILKTTSGKIQRHACRAAYLHDEFEVIFQTKQKSPPAGAA